MADLPRDIGFDDDPVVLINYVMLDELCKSSTSPCIYTYTHMYTYTLTSIYVHTNTCTYIHKHMYIHTHDIFIYIYISIYNCTYIQF